MTPRQLRRQSEYYTMFNELKRIDSPKEAKAFMEEFAKQQGVKFGTIQNKIYDMEKDHGTCDWRQEERVTPADYCEKGVCLVCKRATGHTVPQYVNGGCEACNDTGYYTDAIMHPKSTGADKQLPFTLMQGCMDYDSYVTKCRGASVTPLKYNTYRQHCKQNGGSNSPYSSKIATRNKDIRETLGDMNNITNKAYAMALDMLATKYSVKQSTIANLNRTLKRKSREGRR